jgi:hypothetical protein
MNSCDVQASGAIELLFYGELAGDDRLELEAHLAICRECRGALDELRTIRAALATRPMVTGPADGDWTSLMSRIEFAVAHEPKLLVEAHPVAAVRRWPVPSYLALAALLTLVTSSVAYVAWTARPPVPARSARVAPPSRSEAPAPVPVPESAPATPASTSEADAFAAMSEQHFERSKLVILGLASRDPQTSSSSDWAYERQLAGSLLDDTRLYKQVAEARGMESLAGVMSDLELVLLQTSLSDQQDAATLGRLQRLIRKRDLVSKMEMTRF